MDWSLTVIISTPSRKLGLSPAKIHSIDKIKATMASSKGKAANGRNIMAIFQYSQSLIILKEII